MSDTACARTAAPASRIEMLVRRDLADERPVPGQVAFAGFCDLARRGLEAVLSAYPRSVTVILDEDPRACAVVDVVLYEVGREATTRCWRANHPRARVVACGWGPSVDPCPDSTWLDLTLPAADLAARLVVALHRGPRELWSRPLTAPDPSGGRPDGSAGLVGFAGLNPREAQVIDLIGQGLSNAEITALLHVSINTVKTYIRTGYRKIGVSSRTQAALWAVDARRRAEGRAAPQ